MNPFGISEKSFQLILSAISKFPEIERALIFGSRAKGNYRPGSDVDLAIYGQNCAEQTAMQLSGILNEELPIPCYIDVVSYNHINHPALKEHIDRVGKVFFERSLTNSNKA